MVKRNKRRGRLCRHCVYVNDRGELLCEALGTALATDENLFYFFYIRENYILYYERKGNHVLVMAFARCVRGNVHCYNNTVELALFSFIFEMNL